jgi:hypothetical protein
MAELSLPPDLTEFLQSGNQLQYDPSQCEAGPVGLHSLPELSLANLLVNTYGTPLEGADPHEGNSGYLVPAVSLTNSCEDYDPDFLLLWLPTEDLYGNFDTEHGNLLVFPDTTWGDIVKDPVCYLNSQWEPQSGVAVTFQPWPKYKFSDDETLRLITPVA